MQIYFIYIIYIEETREKTRKLSVTKREKQKKEKKELPVYVHILKNDIGSDGGRQRTALTETKDIGT